METDSRCSGPLCDGGGFDDEFIVFIQRRTASDGGGGPGVGTHGRGFHAVLRRVECIEQNAPEIEHEAECSIFEHVESTRILSE